MQITLNDQTVRLLEERRENGIKLMFARSQGNQSAIIKLKHSQSLLDKHISRAIAIEYAEQR